MVCKHACGLSRKRVLRPITWLSPCAEMSGAPKRVLHVMRMRGVSGAENHLLELTRVLRDEGWLSDVVIPSPFPSKLQQFAEQLAVVCDRVLVVSMKTDIKPTLVLRLARLIRTGRYNIAHAHLVHADWYLAAASLLGRGVPLISSKHNHDAFRSLTAFRFVERLTLRRYSAVIAISQSVRDFTERSTGVTPVTVHYGFPSSDGSPLRRRRQREAVKLLAVGRLEKPKAFEVAIQAMALVKAAAPNAHLSIAGEGKLRPMLAETITALGLTDAVSLLGNRDDIDELMLNADILVHPARWEGFGLVLLEAMNASLPIVSTRASAIPEVVADGETGLLVPPEDADSLAAAVIELIRDPRRREEMGMAGQERLRREFSPEKMARGTVAVYESVLARVEPARSRGAN
jgi:glycosyltransferase involved in cell wall biosynthesis